MAWQYAAMAGFQVVSGLHQAELIRSNAKIAKQITDMNIQFAELDAYNAEIQGFSDEVRYQGIIEDTVKAQDFAFENANVDSDFGTAASVKEETRKVGFLNTLEIKNQAQLKALGYRREARMSGINSMMQTMQSNQQANAAVTSSLIDAGRTGLSGYNYSQGKG